MFADENDDKNKINLQPLLPFSYSFLHCCKTTKTMTLKFSDFQFVSVKKLCKIEHNYRRGLFAIADLLEVGIEKDFFLILWFLTTSKPK